MAIRSDCCAEAVKTKGRWRASKWLILRRLSQLSILGLFLVGPLWGLWIIKGNMASSLTLDVLPLTDPHILAQAMLAGMSPELDAYIGAAIVLVFYALVGGRVFVPGFVP